MGKRKDRGGVSLFHYPIPHRLTDGGRKIVTLTRPNKTPALQARSDSTEEDDEM